jgi:hypothetical protein
LLSGLMVGAVCDVLVERPYEGAILKDLVERWVVVLGEALQSSVFGAQHFFASFQCRLKPGNFLRGEQKVGTCEPGTRVLD